MKNNYFYTISCAYDYYVDGIYKSSKSYPGIGVIGTYFFVNIPVFTDQDLAEAAFANDDFSCALNYTRSIDSAIENDNLPPFTLPWQQKEWGKIANAPDIISPGSYGHGVDIDNWGDDIPWIGLDSLHDYNLSLLDIYNQIIDDILNGTYDSSENIPDTYSEAWEQTLSEAWDKVEQSTDAVPGEGEKDKSTDGDDDDKDDPDGDGGGSGDSNNDQEEPPEGGDDGNTSAKGLVGKDFEDYLTKTIGGNGSFEVDGREFDGGIDNRWWEAKSGNYWNMLLANLEALAKFKSDMGARLQIAIEHGATYELFSNTPIPEAIKEWLIEKGIPFTELLD